MATTTAVAPTNIPPSQSLYIQNLPEKLQKDDLKRALYMLFSAYGPVLDVTALKTAKMRGQAHVLFRDTQAATQALRGCQGFDMFGREMRISYSKNRSNTLAKLTGTFAPTAPAKPEATQAQSTGAAPAFPAPPGTAAPNGLPPPPGLPAKVAQAEQNAPSPQGVKRPREDDEEDEEAPMEEDDDEGAMEMSDEED